MAASKKKPLQPLRYKVIRVDASVGTTEREIERVFGLPQGSVQLILPSRRKARTDKKIGKFLKDWK
jgi:hypothetical protein